MKPIILLTALAFSFSACTRDEFVLDPDEQRRSQVLIADRVEFDPAPIDAYIYYRYSDVMIEQGASPTGIYLYRNGSLMLNATHNATAQSFRDPAPVPGQTYRYVFVARYGDHYSDSSNALTFTVPF